MATVRSIVEKFKEMSPEAKIANMAMLDYIRVLASQTGIDISKWNIEKLFGSGEGFMLLADRKEVNKRFFEKLQKLDDKSDDDEAATPAFQGIDLLKQSFTAAFQRTQSSRKSQLMDTINNAEYYAKDLYRKIEGYISQAAEANRELSMLTQTSFDSAVQKLMDEIMGCVTDGVWVNPVVEGNFFYVNTPTNIVLTHKNKTAGVDITIDFGQLAAKIDLMNFNMYVIPYKNNIVADRYPQEGVTPRFYHPHVNQDSNICWGNARDTAFAHIKKFEIGKALKLLHSVLNIYNDGNPYVPMATYRDHAKKMSGRIAEALKHPDRRKKPADAVTVTVDDNAVT